jgi:hypothetical protein
VGLIHDDEHDCRASSAWGWAVTSEDFITHSLSLDFDTRVSMACVAFLWTSAQAMDVSI